MPRTVDDIFNVIKSKLVDILDVGPETVTLNTSAADVEEWDSLSHIRLMVAVEKAFKLKFKNSEIESLTNVGDLVRLVSAKLA